MHFSRFVWLRLGALIAGLAVLVAVAAAPVCACDVAVVSAQASSTGRPFIWKNFDSSESWHQEMKYFAAKNAGPGGCLMLYYKNSWMQYINGSPLVPQAGVNEAGFTMALTSVYENYSPVHEASNLNTDLMQEALEKCMTLADFESLVKTWPAAHVGHAISGNFVAVDAYGGAALYEMFTGYTASGLMPIMYRKSDANNGQVTDQDGTVIMPAQSNFIGFFNRTNSHYWIPNNPGSERYLRGNALLTALADADSLNASNMMRVVAKDINGKQVNSSSSTNYNTTYCISRSATRSGVVVEGVANGGDQRLTTFWCAFGEPSVGVFIPFFASARWVTPLAYMDTVSSTNVMSDKSDASLLNLAEDYRETYSKLIYSSNRGSTINGPYDNYINLVELAKVQAWTFPIENTLVSQTASYLAYLKKNSATMTAAKVTQSLKDYSDFCAGFAYGNYVKGSSTAVPWTYVAH